MNCDDVCMCVVNKQFELLAFVFDSVYVSLTFTYGSVSLCCVCSRGRVWAVCCVAVVPYVDGSTVVCVACVYAVRV